MADISYTQTATQRRASQGLISGKGDANALRMLVCSTVEVPASASGSTLKFGTIPSNARLASRPSYIYWDDLSTTGSPTLDLGLGSVDGNITSDPDALSAAHDVTSASSAQLVSVILAANVGLPVWDLVSGQTTDPGGQLDVYGSIVDAATAGLTGTVTVELYGYLD